MKISIFGLKSIIQESLIREINIEDVGAIKCVAGSTHLMNTCLIGGNKYYLKFSDESLFDETHPSLQILVEYLSYKIYQAYPSISVPNVKLVFDKNKKRVGLASSEVKGKQGLISVDAKKLGKMLSAGIYVDVFLANWDVVGTDTGNIIVGDNDKATRIDPGGALTFRAQGSRKYDKFSKKAGELSTMLDPSFGGAGKVLSHADMMIASKEFLSVPWGKISSIIKSVDDEITKELLKVKDMKDLLSAWHADVSEISNKLQSRHKQILDHVKKTRDL
jgi:hypothetical protein